jgi:DNA-binding SARP family transcriptional activator
MEFRLLGEVELRAAGQTLDLGGPRLQTVLAALAVDAGRPVGLETLVDRVWDDNPPVEVRNVLYSYLSRIRGLLRQAAALTGETEVRIERRPAGYVLAVDPDLVDLHRFRRLLDQGTDRRDDDALAARLAEALDLWHGPPLAGLPGEWAAQVRDSLLRRRLDAVLQWAQVELRLGHPAAVITSLPDLVTEYPLVEPLEIQLMTALHAAGRDAEALDRYTGVRQRLADELGIAPGPELRALHRAVLQGEPPPPAPHPSIPAVSSVRPESRQAQPAPSTASAAQHGPHRAPAGDSESGTGPTEKPQLPMASSRRVDAVVSGAPPGPAQSRLTRRRTVLATLIAVVVLAASASVIPLSRDGRNGSPSVERAQALFATAHRLDQDGRATEAQATLGDAVRLYGELLTRDPDQDAAPLAPALIQALGRAGIDFSVDEGSMRSWLANPVTPYPAISQVLLLQGWRLKAPVHLDVIVARYLDEPGTASPRNVADVKLAPLEAAVLKAWSERHGTQVTEIRQLLKPKQPRLASRRSR